MNDQQFEELLGRFIMGDLSPADKKLLAQLMQQPESDAVLEKVVKETLMNDSEPDTSIAGSRAKADLMAWLDAQTAASIVGGEGAVHSLPATSAPVRRLSWRYAIAAVFIMLAAGVFLLWHKTPVKETPTSVAVQVNDVPPGHTGAVLTLADGKQIVLDSSNTGNLATQDGAAIAQHDPGQLEYSHKMGSDNTDTALLYNTLTTLRGRHTSVTLSDGTKVWLNASSSIRFPAVFHGNKRKVEVTGEAYFEVAKNSAMPFEVSVLHQGKAAPFEIEVLGTSFNVMAYDDESESRTTLVSGAVKVVHSSGEVRLDPGQQLQIGDGSKPEIVAGADVDKAIAWKNGQFLFRGDVLPSIMKQLSRWYDIDPQFDQNISYHYTGKISRQVNISQVLKMLEAAGGVTFSVQGKVVKVLPKTM